MRSMITPVVALLWIAAPAPPAMAEIPWHNDLQAAHAQAKQEGKQLLMHFYTDDCIWCERLEAGAFQSTALAEAIEKHFVPVKIHAAMNPQIAKTFRVMRFPTDVIVTVDGTVLSHGISPQDPNKYVALLAQHAPSTPPQNGVVQENRTEPPTATVSMPEASQPKANPYAPSAVADASNTQSSVAESFPLPTNLRGASSNVAAYRAQTNPLSTNRSPVASSANATARLQQSDETAAVSEEVSIAPELEAGLMSPAAATVRQPPASDQGAGEPAESETPPVALQGFCPVALMERGAWVAGDPAFGSIHLGQLYLFADEVSLETFRANPEPYTPVMNGNDVILFFEERRVVEGRRDWGLVDPEFNRIFLFASEETMKYFYDHHQEYVRSAIMVTRQAAVEANSKRR